MVVHDRHRARWASTRKRPMGEPATKSLQQGLHTRPTGEHQPDGATFVPDGHSHEHSTAAAGRYNSSMFVVRTNARTSLEA